MTVWFDEFRLGSSWFAEIVASGTAAVNCAGGTRLRRRSRPAIAAAPAVLGRTHQWPLDLVGRAYTAPAAAPIVRSFSGL